jgi:hypothetical protein
MSVLVSDRKESKFEAITYSVELKNLIIELMQRGFGIKDLNAVARRRYAFGKDDIENPAKYIYLIQSFTIRIDKVSSLVATNVRAANSIYPTSIAEYEQRRSYQNTAIANCEQLISELQQIVEVFEVDINIYDRYIQAINREIGLIKKWRQRDNKIKSHLQGNI